MSRRLIDSLAVVRDSDPELSGVRSLEFSNFVMIHSYTLFKLNIALLRLLEQILRRSPG